MAGRAACLVLVLLWPLAGQALELSLPGNATLTREVSSAAESYAVPIGPFADGTLPVIAVEGAVLQQAWRLEAQAITTLQMLRPIRDQLVQAGYEILLDCAAQDCGGFDFRFATRVMPAPDMFVDFFDYRFLSVRKDRAEAGSDYVTLLISRSGSTGYIQLIRVARDRAEGLSVAGDTPGVTGSSTRAADDSRSDNALWRDGHVILSDLTFESGTSDLGAGPYASLTALADLLNADPALRVALVGHTDAVGGLAANVALSKRRAEAVRARLIKRYGVSPEQLDAEGMGYLSPIASNQDQPGREANRRVEAVLLNSP